MKIAHQFLFGSLLTLFFFSGIQVLAQTTNQVNLLWEANTYTPAFYRGHSAVTPGSKVTVVADAFLYDGRGNRLDDASLNFDWRKDNRPISSASGLGGKSLVFTAGAEGLAHKIEVTATGPSGQNASHDLLIPVRDPKILIYEDHPLTGPSYHQAILNNYNLVQPEITLIAEPYFFSQAEVKNRRLQYTWFLNKQATTFDQAKPNRLTLVVPENQAGENELQLNLSNLDNILQAAKTKLAITFNQSNFNF